jgi:hypothetical protein
LELVKGRGPYGDGPFEAFRHSLNRMRAMILSTNVPAWPWLSYKHFNESEVRESDLYQELIFHAGLCGADQFLYWNPRPKTPAQPGENDPDEDQDRLLSDCLHELDEMVGAADRRTLVHSLSGWYDDYVLTGMSTGERTVWRFTPKLASTQKREGVLRSKAPVTFRTVSTEIKFPAGTVVARAGELSNQGYWIIASPGTQPVISEIR